jgi:ABC-type uncharacterized transport system permease subunit
LKIVVREFGPLLLQLAFGDVPVAFDFEYCYGGVGLMWVILRNEFSADSQASILCQLETEDDGV